MAIEAERDTMQESGGPLATLPELAALLGLSGSSIKRTLHRAGVRYIEGPPPRYPVVAALAAVEPHRAELEAQREKGVAQQAAAKRAAREKADANLLAKTKRRATATATPSKAMGQPGPMKHTSAFPPRSLGNPSPSRPAPPRRAEPEVFIMRRRPLA
jgi:hypothetical protein